MSGFGPRAIARCRRLLSALPAASWKRGVGRLPPADQSAQHDLGGRRSGTLKVATGFEFVGRKRRVKRGAGACQARRRSPSPARFHLSRATNGCRTADLPCWRASARVAASAAAQSTASSRGCGRLVMGTNVSAWHWIDQPAGGKNKHLDADGGALSEVGGRRSGCLPGTSKKAFDKVQGQGRRHRPLDKRLSAARSNRSASAPCRRHRRSTDNGCTGARLQAVPRTGVHPHGRLLAAMAENPT